MTEKIGRQLRQARENKELTLEEASKALYIRVPYLQALEEGTFDKIPTKVQLHGFLRSYASYLDLPVREILGEKPAEEIPPDSTSEQSESTPSGQSSPPTPEETTRTFKEIGQSLFHQREILGLSKDDIEAHTHIPAHYITFLEDGDFGQFPSPTQARGMLANYSDFLDMDTSSLMLKYADALQARLSARQVESPSQTKAPVSARRARIQMPRVPPWVRMFFSPDTFLVGITGIALIAFIIWGIGRITRTQAELQPIPTAPSLVEALLPTASASPTGTVSSQATPELDLLDVGDGDPGEEEATAIPTIDVASPTSIQLFLVIRQRTYLRVTVDGETAFAGRALPDESYTFNGEQRIELLAGNAAAIQVIFNDQDLGTLGIFGEVVDLIYTREGVIIPTDLPTATLSPEDLATATPEPTSTPGDDDTNLPPSQNTPIP